jgi:dual specificity tyrosine-phosphorylation-regulated kinase 2/3/4
MALIRRFAVQLLMCLKSLRKLRIIHCDLKPENILLKQQHKSGIKVIDFGSSCFEEERVYTYIQSRFYRAPEIILGISYTTAIDMWSLGCILAELHSGLPLFPGESEHEQLLCIMEVQGLPPAEVLEASTRKKMFFELTGEPKIIANRRGKKRFPSTRPLQDALRCQDDLFMDFLRRKL